MFAAGPAYHHALTLQVLLQNLQSSEHPKQRPAMMLLELPGILVQPGATQMVASDGRSPVLATVRLPALLCFCSIAVAILITTLSGSSAQESQHGHRGGSKMQ
jgi:hypothetical protein